MELLFLKPVFQERIWGGKTLQQWFPKAQLSDNIGECWAISAHMNGMSSIINGAYEGQSLKQVYEKHPELFGNPKEQIFPLLVKILDAAANLSVQVHPDDTYALAVEGELGKTECWYVLDAKPDAKIIYGHTAASKQELVEMVESGQWNDLLIEVPVKKGDFFYVPSGTVHALCAGTLVLEVQQSSDTTYRLYDYDRLDDEGNKRELHIEKSLEVITIPHKVASLDYKENVEGTTTITELVSNHFFTVKKVSIKDSFNYKREAPYVLITVVSGSGKVDGRELIPGTSFIIPNTVDAIEFVGTLDLILSYV